MFKWLFGKKKEKQQGCSCCERASDNVVQHSKKKHLTKEEIETYNEKLRTDRDAEFRATVEKLGKIIDDLYDDYAHRQMSEGYTIMDTFCLFPKDAAKYGWTEDDSIRFLCKGQVRVRNYVVEFYGHKFCDILDSILKITKS